MLVTAIVCWGDGVVFSVDVSKAGKSAVAVAEACEAKGANVRVIDSNTVGLSFGESITKDDVLSLVRGSVATRLLHVRPTEFSPLSCLIFALMCQLYQESQFSFLGIPFFWSCGCCCACYTPTMGI